MSSAGDVKEFLSRHRVSVATEYAARTGVTEAVAAGVHYRLDATIDEMLHDSASRVYEDSESGARKLAADICERIGPLAGATTSTPAGRASLGGAASPFAQRPLAPGRAPGRSAGPAGGTTGAGRRTVMDALAGRAADAMADATPSTSVAEAALQGAAGAVTGRAGVLSGNLPALEDVRAGARLVAYLANEANISQADEMVERFATQSPAEGARVIQNWEDLKRVHATNFAVKQATSVGVGTLLGRVAGALIPGGGAVSMATGAASIGNSLAELGQGFKRFEQNNPQIGRAVRTHADHSLQKLSERSRETTMDVQMQSEWG
ncbi:hypothetical protein ACFYN5_10735 [Streptomyces sp. NPDC007126]|uniref:hypothetical protein n=1 Tax=Streptomyces sp. NPDC007126 TaxID=3364774 RepID=UPI0036C7942C